MDFTLDDTELALRDELRRFLTDACDPDRRRAAIDLPGAVDRELWVDLASMGVFSVALPEEEGGVGLGLAHAAIVFEELGRAAVPGPTISTFLAAGLIDTDFAGAGSGIAGRYGCRLEQTERGNGLGQRNAPRALGRGVVERAALPLVPPELFHQLAESLRVVASLEGGSVAAADEQRQTHRLRVAPCAALDLLQVGCKPCPRRFSVVGERVFSTRDLAPLGRGRTGDQADHPRPDDACEAVHPRMVPALESRVHP